MILPLESFALYSVNGRCKSQTMMARQHIVNDQTIKNECRFSKQVALTLAGLIDHSILSKNEFIIILIVNLIVKSFSYRICD